MTEFVLYGGKGGVGKTTVATASALSLARAGHETLVVSTDPAHSLSDSVEMDVGGEPTEIRDRLYGVEVDPQEGVDRYKSLFEALNEELDDVGVSRDDDDVGDLFSSGVMPGSDELAALEGLATYLDADQFDRVVFDTAPTGHTLRLLDMPSVLESGMETALDIHGEVQRKKNVTRTLLMGPLAIARRESGDPEEIVEMRDEMAQVGDVLRDPDRTEFRVVTLPETMAVNESTRLVEQLREFEVPVTTVVVNKVIEDPGDCERCQARRTVQQESVDALRETFADLDLWTLPEEYGEVTGLEQLGQLADNIDAAEN